MTVDYLTFFTHTGSPVVSELTSKEETHLSGTQLREYEIREVATQKLLGRMRTYPNWNIRRSAICPQSQVGQSNGWIEISRIDNYTVTENKVKGIGTFLIQCAIEESTLKGFQGRLRLIACDHAAYFFWSCGFRPVYKKMEREMCKDYLNSRLTGQHAAFLGGVYMQLAS